MKRCRERGFEKQKKNPDYFYHQLRVCCFFKRGNAMRNFSVLAEMATVQCCWASYNVMLEIGLACSRALPQPAHLSHADLLLSTRLLDMARLVVALRYDWRVRNVLAINTAT